MPARRRTPFSSRLEMTLWVPYRERKTAVSIPSGTPRMIAPSVTTTVPTIIGKIPYKSIDGFHFIPKKKWQIPFVEIAGTPFANMNTQIRTTAAMETDAAIKKIRCITFSFACTVFCFFMKCLRCAKMRNSVLFYFTPFGDCSRVNILYRSGSDSVERIAVVDDDCDSVDCNFCSGDTL